MLNAEAEKPAAAESGGGVESRTLWEAERAVSGGRPAYSNGTLQSRCGNR